MKKLIASRYFLKLASSTLKTESMTGKRLVQRLTTSRPMVITLQLGTRDNLRVNKGTGGLEDTRTVPPNQLPPEKTQGDGHIGTLMSPYFTITGHYILFLIGGGCDINTIRAELIIDNKVSSVLPFKSVYMMVAFIIFCH